MRATTYIPPYIESFHNGILKDRIGKLHNILESCVLCPHNCKVNRLKGEVGICLAGEKMSLSSAFPHFGEEAPLVVKFGSGTIFFSNCNLRCVFCQNFDISHKNAGNEAGPERLAELMLYLQGVGCPNINFVTPTIYAPQIIAALPLAINMGLTVPLVWNSSGFESLEVIKLLDGIIDIYMPDIKFGDQESAAKLSMANGYFDNVKLVLKEMHKQVGDLELDENNTAVRGVLIRHLVMPEGSAGSNNIMKFIAEEISPHSYVNIMDQYRPAFKASKYKQINRKITKGEYDYVLQYAGKVGLSRGFK